MRIMHVSTKKSHSCFSDLIRLQAKEHDVLFVVLFPCDNPEYSVTENYDIRGARYVHLSVSKDFYFNPETRLEFAFAELIKEFQPDVIHMQLFAGINILSILRASSSSLAKKFITLHEHSLFCVQGVCYDKGHVCALNSLEDCSCDPSQWNAKRNALSLVAYNRVRKARCEEILSLLDGVICCSHWQKEILSRLFSGITKTKVLYYGVNKAWGSIRRVSSFPCFGYVGSLSGLKGVDVLLDAVKQLGDAKFQLLMGVLFDPEKQSDVAYVKKLKEHSSIKVMENLLTREILYEKVYSQIDYLIVPSLWEETGPMTLFEAFSYKIPVIVTNRPSILEKAKEGVNALVFDNADTLACMMKDVISGGGLASRTADSFSVKTGDEYAAYLHGIYAGKMESNNNSLTLNVGSLCNNNCIFCVRGGNDSKMLVDLNIIRDKLEKYSGQYGLLKVTGGEPTLRKDLASIFRIAHELGYKITLETNARMFADMRLVDEIVPFNSTVVTHLESYKRWKHDAIVRAEGSFLQTVSGIRNLRKHGVDVGVKVMVLKYNYRDLLMMSKFISTLGVKHILFIFLDPGGYADKFFDAIVPQYGGIRPFLSGAISWVMQNTKMKITLENFPYCCVDSSCRGFESQRITGSDSKALGFSPGKEKGKMYNCAMERLSRKQKSAQCATCKFDAGCEGVYTRYINSFGWEEFRPVIESKDAV